MCQTASGLRMISSAPWDQFVCRQCTLQKHLFFQYSSSERPLQFPNNSGGLDTIWITCGYLALMLVGAIVGITLVAKRWIRADTMDQEYGVSYSSVISL